MPPSSDDRLEALERLRSRIDQLDDEIVRLVNERSACAVEIGRTKLALGQTIYQPQREREVLHRARERNGGPLDAAAVTRIFERIIDEARRLERIDAGDRDS